MKMQFALLLLVAWACAGPVAAFTTEPVPWTFAGPTTYKTRGDDLPLAGAGAVQDVVQGANNTFFIGSVNGGVWRTTSLKEESPRWENVLDGQPVTCSSISAMHVSASNPNVVYAGCGGSTSSEQGADWNVVNSGSWAGVMMSTDSGDTWAMMDNFPVNFYVTDIHEIRATGTLLVAAQSHLYERNDGGIWRKDASSPSFERVSAQPTFTLMIGQ